MSPNFNCDVCNKQFLNKTAFHFHQKWSHMLEDRQNGSKEQLEDTEETQLEEIKDQNVLIDSLNDDDPALEQVTQRSSYNKRKIYQVETCTRKSLKSKRNIVQNNDCNATMKKSTKKRRKRNTEIDLIDDINPELEKFIIERYLKRKANNCLGDENQMKNPEETSLLKENDETYERSNEYPTRRKYLVKQKSQNKRKRFQCQFCSKSFKLKRHCKDHMKIVHSCRKLLHKCSFCQKKFPIKRNLQLHTMAVHEKLRPFKCQLCEQRFSQKSNLQSHHKKVHKEENIPIETPGDADKQSSSNQIQPFKCH